MSAGQLPVIGGARHWFSRGQITCARSQFHRLRDLFLKKLSTSVFRDFIDKALLSQYVVIRILRLYLGELYARGVPNVNVGCKIKCGMPGLKEVKPRVATRKVSRS